MNKQEAKADAGKPEIDLVPPQIIRDIAEVRMYGNKKYGDPDNWRTVELRRYTNALLRHTLAFMEDNNSTDEESGIAHYKHMACNLAFICEMLRGAAPSPAEECEHDWIWVDSVGANDIFVCRKCHKSKTESVRRCV